MNMKTTAVAVAVAGAVGAVTVCLKDETRREQMKQKAVSLYQSARGLKEEESKNFTLGNPKPYSEDSKMVGEGSLYSVQRYNEEYQQS
ncbi:hypothetical protein [Shouchella shacheensis]|uniref:hypothetical protein n=1 Tax=Shouchella shacheensis TaxID=1649580 RepID=UPI00073FDB41|nr:hypothetical protein [Shouchella shacheensis]